MSKTSHPKKFMRLLDQKHVFDGNKSKQTFISRRIQAVKYFHPLKMLDTGSKKCNLTLT